jgi:hypothetical protein
VTSSQHGEDPRWDNRVPWYLRQSRVNELAKELLAAADLANFCGLSARAPDTVEVDGLVRAIRAGALTLQVGIAGPDEDNDLAKLLNASAAGRGAFIDAGDLTRLRGHLAGRFALTNDQWDRLCV